MTTKLRVYTNEDDALLFWSIPEPITQCRGFAIERKLTHPNRRTTQTFLLNRTAFDSQPRPTVSDRGQSAISKPSTEWPFQRFSWTDHDADTGDTVSYRVIPVVRQTSDLSLLESHASPWSTPRTLGSPGHSRYRAFFNRGFIMSQFMARYLAERNLTLKQFKETISDQDDKSIRQFLAGGLRVALLAELEEARQSGGHIYAALFELSDDELIGSLCALRDRAHLVLANGSVEAAKGEPAPKARQRDENEAARTQLLAANVAVDKTQRFIAPGALGHNKFMIRTDAGGTPLTAWTGSTNWAPTGLCTQINNGLLINDSNVARVYLDQWEALRQAQNEFPKALVSANNKPKAIGTDAPGVLRSTVWFTRTQKGVDLDALREEVGKAREGILFLMFMPGLTGLFSTILTRSAETDLYVRGVVSTLPKGQADPSALEIGLIDGENHTPLHLDIVQPEGMKHPFANFAAEVTRSEFLGWQGVGHAIIHSKVLVIDPFSADPVVITGSHNFSITASQKNDENFIIVKGDPELAEAYAVNILGVYAHYRWRAFLSQTNKPLNWLKDNDQWQSKKLSTDRRELRFWGV